MLLVAQPDIASEFDDYLDKTNMRFDLTVIEDCSQGGIV
jgi:hypothetical protein